MLEIEDLMQLKADKAVLAIIFFKNVVTGKIKLLPIRDSNVLAAQTAELTAEDLGDDWSWIVYHRFANVDDFGGFERSSNYNVT